MQPPNHPESLQRPGNPRDEAQQTQLLKPPLPSLSYSNSREESIEVQLPPVIAGALVAAFATTVAGALDNELLTHYYLSDLPVKVNLDRVWDGLMAEFNHCIWGELWNFYYGSNSDHARQLCLLFQGPIRQIILILSGPELSRCILDRIGPGLSRRPVTWTQAVTGVGLPAAVQLVCRWWHYENPSRSPGGSPDDIARTIATHIVSGDGFRRLLSRARQLLYSPHHVQNHLVESAAWDIVTRRPYPPPLDGFHIMQLRFECDPRPRIMEEGHLDIGLFPAVVGTANQCLLTTIGGYAQRHWTRCERVVLNCMSQAVGAASQSFQQGHGFVGMSLWDESDPESALFPGLRLFHLEVEEGTVRVTASSWILALVQIMQQMAWTCAALSSSPFPESITECGVQISNWEYSEESTFIDSTLIHRAVPPNQGTPWLQQRRAAVVVPGFPIEERSPPGPNLQ